MISKEDRATLEGITWKDPKRMSGTLCFRGTRVPVKNLTDYLKHGHSLERFLEGFPGVEREQGEHFLRLSARMADGLAVPEQEHENESRQPARGLSTFEATSNTAVRVLEIYGPLRYTNGMPLEGGRYPTTTLTCPHSTQRTFTLT
ncbi:MAG: hypothetical protein BRD29_05215 [Bacteroidetes bacterium QH_2_67_10]|nr:MAG: hypothetical protein BRD29_05215 [Bacteroidetes bacterium QH_2_67_10]